MAGSYNNPAKNYGRLSSYNSLGEFGTAYSPSNPSFPGTGGGTQNSTRSSMLYAEAGSGGVLSPGISPSPTSSTPFLPGAVAHPYSAGTPHFIRGDSSMSTDVLRAKGSRASLLAGPPPSSTSIGRQRDHRRSTLPHSYSGHSSDGGSGSGASSHPSSSTDMLVQHLGGGGTNNRQSTLSPNMQVGGGGGGGSRRPRVSGPPHARHSRIEIVTPAPLGPPPGSIVAVDKATLAFSALSGIGASDTVMGLSDFVPTATAPNIAAGVGAPPDGGVPVQRRAGSSPPSTSTVSSGPSTSAAAVISRPTTGSRQHSRAFSAATTTASSSAHFSDESLSSSSVGGTFAASSSSTGSSPTGEAVPPLPVQYTKQHAEGEKTVEKGTTAGPQSPLDKLKFQLQGEARRVGSQY